ncbi:hypothetical protein K4K58_007658 [Colletotrichum sp. SAR11_239]|nr:hypothetical protein K4K58_007658 [Colletotrichum sp. SAR11_239]
MAAWASHGNDFARLILILEAASRTFDALESGLSASTVERTFKPIGNSSDSEEGEEVAGDVVKALKSVVPHAAVATIGSRATPAETE